MDGAPAEPDTPTWHHHNNVFEKGTVAAGIRKHYAEPDGLALDDYLLYSGLTQGLMLQHALESIRGRDNGHGGLFWMYADCWGEVGWTILDYGLRRKTAYYFVRRAFAPVRLILRPDGKNRIRLTIANDTREKRDLELEYGYIPFDGKPGDLKRVKVTAAAAARTAAAVFPRGRHDPLGGLWIARVRNGAGETGIEPAIFRAADFRQLHTADPGMSVKRAGKLAAGRLTLTVAAAGYAHAVRLHLPDGALPGDNHFDLLPGATRRVTITGLKPGAQIRITAANAPSPLDVRG